MGKTGKKQGKSKVKAQGWLSWLAAGMSSVLGDAKSAAKSTAKSAAKDLFDDTPPPRNGSHLVVVYGTLRKGKNNHRRLNGADKVGEANVIKHQKTTRVGGPAIVPSRNHTVQGELYCVDGRTLREIDTFEAPEFERRRVELDDGRTAWAYVYQKKE